MIQNHILRHTPIGICIEEAIEIIDNNAKWGNPVVNRENGFSHPSPWVHGATGMLLIGEQSVQTLVRVYGMMPFHGRNVRILWGFDEEGKLIEVYVRSTFSPRLV
jgi:hypothetical protein